MIGFEAGRSWATERGTFLIRTDTTVPGYRFQGKNGVTKIGWDQWRVRPERRENKQTATPSSSACFLTRLLVRS